MRNLILLLLLGLLISCTNERNQIIGDYYGEATIIDTEIILTYDMEGNVIDAEEQIDTIDLSDVFIEIRKDDDSNDFTITASTDMKRINEFSSQVFEINDSNEYEATKLLGYTNSYIDFSIIEGFISLRYKNDFQDPPTIYEINFIGEKY